MTPINRRQFLTAGAALMVSATQVDAFNIFSSTGPDDISGTVFRNDAPSSLWKWSEEAYTYTTLSDNQVMCDICPNQCRLSPGDRSVCRSKVNHDGRLYTLTYGNPCAVNIDPVEKKPLYHFKPRSKAFSIATTGCNFRCLNCQNWEISQAKPHEVRHMDLYPEEVVTQAIKEEAFSIAYTYSEAVTYFEYMIKTAHIARKKGIRNLWISNGYINPSPLDDLCNVLDAANVNLKAFSDAIYRKLNGGRLEPVLNTFETLHRKNIHFEITNLIVPGYTDNLEMVKKMCDWILEKLGPDHPLHFSRFFPMYKLDRLSPTPVSVLSKFRLEAIKRGIRYVYVGNVPGHEGNHTYCHKCKKLLIKRNGYIIAETNIINGKCIFCNETIPGVWE